MSAHIGMVVNGPNSVIVAQVKASTEGVEVSVSRPLLDPIAARNLAALLVRAADEAERMRAR